MTLTVTPVTLPSDLISASNGRLNTDLLIPVGFWGRGTGHLHRAAATAWKALVADCFSSTGVTLTVTSLADAYRSYERQKTAFLTRMEPVSLAVYLATSSSRRRRWSYNGHSYWRLRTGYAPVATPGTSNHGWGLALDVCEITPDGRILGISSSTAWGWLKMSVARYGFSWELQSEPWHLRYYKGDGIPVDLPPSMPPFAPEKGQWGLWPVNANKPYLEPTVPTMKGDAVRYLQGVILFRAGGNITVDGDYGQFTQARVRDLQRWFGLEPDAEVGPVTWKLIDDLA